MFKNYFKIALRNIKKHKGYSFINIAGLSVGIACCILILLWIQDELSYDEFHQNAHHIYRITRTESRESGKIKIPMTYANVAPLLKEEYPGVENYVRFGREYRAFVKYDNNGFLEERFFYADPSVFSVFDFSLSRENAELALTEPYSVVLTQNAALKYFGTENPIGKILKVNDKEDYVITGILNDLPHNSHIQFDFLASFSTLYDKYKEYINAYWAYQCYTYIIVSNPTIASNLNQEFDNFILKHKGEKFQSYMDFSLQSLTDIHLHSNLNYELETNGDIRYIYIFSVIAFFIMLIACINFMNLSTARSSLRSREVGLRKTLGAHQSNLICQFLSESTIFTIISLPCAFSLVYLSLPLFNHISDKALQLHVTENIFILLSIAGIVIFMGLISGSYPAFLLSSFKPAHIFKDELKLGSSSSVMRKLLVVFQFTASLILITGTIIVYRQIHFIKNEKLGFHKDRQLVIHVRDNTIRKKYLTLKNELLKSTNIISVTASSAVPGTSPGVSVFRPADSPNDSRLTMRNLVVDYDFIETMGIELKEGRNFTQQMATDATSAYLINESAAKKLGWSSAINKELIDLDSGPGTVIGVVRDFHFQSKHQIIEPLIINILPDTKYIYYITVRIGNSNISNIRKFIESRWKKISSNQPLDYFFLDHHFDQLYQKEKQMGNLLIGFTLLGMFIACLGLLGLASFTAERRTREIGIRKVLGASVSGIFVLLSREYFKWILTANLIAWPLAYYIMNNWLNNFAYRINMTLWMFILAGSISLITALLSVVFHTFKTARMNPIDTIKYE